MANIPIENRVKLTYNICEVNTMAEFCVQCWSELNEINDPPEAYILSRELDLCEGCGEWKRVIVAKRKRYFLRLFISNMLNHKKRE